MKEMSVAEQRSIDEDRWRSVDLRELDLEDQLSRYIRLRGQKASPDTLATYRQRVGRAIELTSVFSTILPGSKARRLLVHDSRVRLVGVASRRPELKDLRLCLRPRRAMHHRPKRPTWLPTPSRFDPAVWL